MNLFKQKNNGFTLVEVLAAVTILGIISVVAILGINNIIQNAKEKHYITAEQQLKLAGQSYTQQNRSALPKAIGQKSKIPLKTLVDKNYIKIIKDYSDNNCDLDKSYVQVFKYSQNDYSYVAYLDCPAYNSKEEIKKGSPTITISVSDPNKSKKESAIVKITDNEKLLSWSYIIYKDGEEVKNSGSTKVENYAKSLTETIDLAKYTPGKVKIVVTATNIYGLTTTKSTGTVDFKDTQGPTCIIKEEDKKNNPKNWTKGPVTITVGCDDGDGVGCSRKEYSKTFKTTTNVGKIIIEDKEGNETTCEVSVNVDTTAPTKPTMKLYKWKNNSTTPSSTSGLSTYTSNTWSNLNIYAVASESTDKEVGNVTYQYTTTGAAGSNSNKTATTKTITTEGISTIKYRACDGLGNCSDYTTASTVKLDKTAPTCSSSGGSATWTNGNRTLIGTCSDTLSGCTGNAKKTYSSNTNSTTESPGKVKDNAGNEATCPGNQTVKIDKTPPTVPTGGYIGNVSGSNTTGTIQGAASGSTDSGGSGLKEYRYLVKTSSGAPANSNSSFTTSRNFTRTCGTTYYAYAIAVDNAGNRSQVKSLGTTSDKANSYSSWSSCSTTCGTGTQTRTNSCALVTTELSQSCTNTSTCCSGSNKVVKSYGSWSACSKKCGGGTRSKTIYYKSSINGQDCGTSTETQSCETQSCCSSTKTTWGSWSGCSASCGTGTQQRTGTKYSVYDGRNCGTTSDTRSCDTGITCGPPAHKHSTGVLGTTLKACNWTLSCGTYHPTAYYGYCGVCWNYGKIYRANTSKYCPGRNRNGCKNWGTLYPTVVPD